MITHNGAADLIRLGKNGRKFLEHKTYLESRGADFAILLHKTDVVTIHSDGTFTLNSGGWRTVTTKDRINKYSPAHIQQTKGLWYIGTEVFRDGLCVDSAGVILEGALS